jgi:hypothetical protein
MPDDAAKGIRQPVPMCHADQIPLPSRPESLDFLDQNRAVPFSSASHLCRCLDLGESLADFVSLLLLGTEELEALEVGQGFSALCPLAALGPLARLPLLVDLALCPELLQRAGSEGTRDLELELGEEDI